MGIVSILLEMFGVISGLLFVFSGGVSDSLLFTSSMFLLIGGILQLFEYNIKRLNKKK